METAIKAAMVAAAAIFGLMAPASADILTVFDVSGAFASSPNSNPATFSGNFTLDQTTGMLAGVDLNTPVGTFTGSHLDFVNSRDFQTTSNGPAFAIATYSSGGGTVLQLAFAGTADNFTGGDVLTDANSSIFPSGEGNPSLLACDTFVPACNGSGGQFYVVSGVATAAGAPVPEPGSLALFGFALAGTGLTLRASRERAGTNRKSPIRPKRGRALA